MSSIPTTQPIRRKTTLHEFWALPEGPPHYEFEEGEIIPVTSPSERHQDALLALASALRAHIRDNRLGRIWIELDVELPTGRVYIPDIVYLSADHLSYLGEKDGKIHGVPDLIVEVLSPHSRGRDRIEKFNAYRSAEVPWYWIVDPDAWVIEEFHAEPNGYVRTAGAAEGEPFRPAAFPGLEIELKSLVE